MYERQAHNIEKYKTSSAHCTQRVCVRVMSCLYNKKNMENQNTISVNDGIQKSTLGYCATIGRVQRQQLSSDKDFRVFQINMFIRQSLPSTDFTRFFCLVFFLLLAHKQKQ